MQILQHFHSVNRWIILVLLILTIITAFQGWFGKKTYTEGDRKKALFTLIFTHVQFIMGTILVIPYFQTGGSMKDPVWRFYSVEHTVMMVLAIILITAGYSISKRKTVDLAKFKTTAICYLIALLLILGGIPWPFREGLAGGWY